MRARVRFGHEARIRRRGGRGVACRMSRTRWYDVTVVGAVGLDRAVQGVLPQHRSAARIGRDHGEQRRVRVRCASPDGACPDGPTFDVRCAADQLDWRPFERRWDDRGDDGRGSSATAGARPTGPAAVVDAPLARVGRGDDRQDARASTSSLSSAGRFGARLVPPLPRFAAARSCLSRSSSGLTCWPV